MITHLISLKGQTLIIQIYLLKKKKTVKELSGLFDRWFQPQV